jgi:LPXTG-motif cell wall-anchored protein
MDMSARSLGADRIRAALNYSIQKGYTDGNPQQVQLAVWYLRDNTWHGEQRVIAEEIVREAATAPVPVSTGEGISLSDAITQNRVTVTARFVPQTQDAFYGDGTVTIQNTGTSEVRVYMPMGVTFSTVASAGTFQDLLVYELAVQQGTTTPGGATASPATTQQATTQPTLTALTTPIGTTTVEVTGTVTSTVVATGTTTVEATTAVTGTVEATTTVVATAETTATAEITAEATVEATATEVPTVEALPTDTPVTQPLPQTGDESGTNNTALIVFALGLALIATGFGTTMAARRRS